jgi:hypothetical protein
MLISARCGCGCGRVTHILHFIRLLRIRCMCTAINTSQSEFNECGCDAVETKK